MPESTFDLEETIGLLERTPKALASLLSGLSESFTREHEGKDTMDVYDVLGHLIYGERVDWMPRARIILRQGEAGTFEPFDRWGHRQEIEGKSLNLLLNELARLRHENLIQLRSLNLNRADFDRRARHPELGLVTLAQLLSTWAAHDLTHLHQISRLLAEHYREAVGPWTAYLGVMQCNGHSA